MPRRVAFFGATGGCALACLVLALKAGHHASALARNPDKLKEALISRGIDIEKATFHIVQGHIREMDAVRKTLLFDGEAVEVVICGIGSYSLGPIPRSY